MTIRFQPLAVIAFALGSLPSFAQHSHVLLEDITIDGAKRAVFEQAQHEYCEAVVRGGAPACYVLAPTTFSHNSNYLVLLPFQSFTHYDEGTYTSKGMTPEQAKELSTRRGPTIKHNEETGFELAFHTGESLTPTTKIIHITDVQTRPGYEAEVIRALQTAQGTTHGLAVYRVVAGANTGRLLVMRFLDRFADMDKLPPLPQAAQTAAWKQGVISAQVTVMQQRPDLTAVPAAMP